MAEDAGTKNGISCTLLNDIHVTHSYKVTQVPHAQLQEREVEMAQSSARKVAALES